MRSLYVRRHLQRLNNLAVLIKTAQKQLHQATHQTRIQQCRDKVDTRWSEFDQVSIDLQELIHETKQ